MKKLLVKVWSYGDDLVSGFFQRYKSKANARYAFKNYDLKSDIYTVAQRFKDKNGTTVGAKLRKKWGNSTTLYSGRCVDYKDGVKARILFANAPDFKMPPSPWTGLA